MKMLLSDKQSIHVLGRLLHNIIEVQDWSALEFIVGDKSNFCTKSFCCLF